MELSVSNGFVILLLFSTASTFKYQPETSPSGLGDSCDLRNNEQGICVDISECEHAKELNRLRRTSEIVRCEFIGRSPIVCCPKAKKSSKSSKFQKALCTNEALSLQIENNIVSGQKATVGEFPFQVAIGYRDKRDNSIDFRCGGSLIADDIVLTAAHCVSRHDDELVMVRLGRTSIDLGDADDDTEAQDIRIQMVKTHPQYSKRSGHNDIALIKLFRPAILSQYVNTICLSSNDNSLPKTFTISGFGRIDPSSSMTSDWLLKGSIGLYPSERCRNTFQSYGKNIIDSQLCALSDSGVGSCNGDSGGPMSYEKDGRKYVYGIISYGIGCGTNYPLVYTKVNKFLDWIEREFSVL